MSDNHDIATVEKVAGQLESIEKYLTRDIDRQDDAIAEVFRRLNDVEKLAEKVKGIWLSIAIGGTVVGTVIGYALQLALAALKTTGTTP